MAEYHNTTERRSGGAGVIAFIVGGLVVAVGIIAYVLMGGDTMGSRPAASGSPDIEINATADSAAGGGATEGAAAADAGTDGAEAAAGATGSDGASATAGAQGN